MLFDLLILVIQFIFVAMTVLTFAMMALFMWAVEMRHRDEKCRWRVIEAKMLTDKEKK